MQECKQWQSASYNLIPGTKLCKTCRKRLTKPDPSPPHESSEDNDNDDLEYNETPDDIDESLTEMGVSPIKKHGKSQRHRRSEVKRKVKTLEGSLANLKENVFGNQVKDQSLDKTTLQKAEHFDEMVSLIKDKLQLADKRTTTQLITLAPKSMSLSQVMSTFNVTEYQARKARQLFQEKGLLAVPPSYNGKVLPKDVSDMVVAFYENDENSRLMPGKKDCVSIAKNVHMQKRLILSSLKELFESFRSRNPSIQVGYSKFCSLRPKWCVLPGANGTHLVCVCTYHQNTKLLVEALNSNCTYKDLLAKLVCSVENKHCMLGRCKDCPEEED